MFYDPQVTLRPLPHVTSSCVRVLAQDVRWFKPAELTTKHGMRGHIKEPVGTHGLLKAQFSAPIKQHDTIMLILYKRMFPKFPDEGVDVA